MSAAADLAAQLTELQDQLTAARETSWLDDRPAEQRLAALSTAVAAATGHLSYLLNGNTSPLRQLIVEQAGGAS